MDLGKIPKAAGQGGQGRTSFLKGGARVSGLQGTTGISRRPRPGARGAHPGAPVAAAAPWGNGSRRLYLTPRGWRHEGEHA
jgi:hypothetical protein